MEGDGGHSLSLHLRYGVIAAIVTLVLDQASKFWLVRVFDIAHRGTVELTPFFDLVLAWNQGISFGWFQNDGAGAQIVLMAIKALAVVVLAVWMVRSRTLIARLDHGRGHRKRDRPPGLWRGCRFCPAPRQNRRKYL
jgi:signal peptidase II